MKIIQDINRDLVRLDLSTAALRNFGLLFCAVFALWAGVAAWQGNLHWFWPACAAIIFMVAGVLFPSTLRRPFRLWMALAFVLGWFVTRTILIAAYAVIMTPIGLLLRAAGKDLLDERLERDSASYWKKHESPGNREQYKKQF